MANKKIKIRNRLDKRSNNWLVLGPILAIIGVIPLITYGKGVQMDQFEMLVSSRGDINIDFFSYYKALFFVLLSYSSLFSISLLLLKKSIKLKKSWIYIPLGIYTVFTFLSFVLSDYKVVASRGFVDMHQGVWVLMGYAILVFVFYNLVETKYHVRTLIKGFLFSATIVGTIGLFQFFGADIFKTKFGKLLILPEHMHHMVEGLSFNFAEHTIYSTLFNSNFVGSFATLLVPLSIVLFLNSKDSVHKFLYYLFYLLMIVVWLGSNSRAGYLGISIGLIILITLMHKKHMRDFKKIVPLIAGLVFVAFMLNHASEGRTMSQVSRLLPSNEEERLDQIADRDVRIVDIIIDDLNAEIITEKESLLISVLDSQLKFFDSQGQLLEISVNEDDEVTIKDDRYENFEIDLNRKNSQVTINAYGKKIPLYSTPEGFRMINPSGAMILPRKAEYISILDGREKFASSRGYIWSRSIPMLKDTVLIGYGPDTYPIVFPQDDVVGKLNSFSSYGRIVDKPHNMYLQIGINTGLLSLLAMLSLFLIYIYDSLRLYLRWDSEEYLYYIGIGIFVGIVSYLTAGVFNDQMISVAPLFYSMLGLGFAVNRIISNEQN